MKTKAIFFFWLMLMVLYIPASGYGTAGDWYAMGYKLMDQGEIDKANYALDKAIELNNNYSAAWNLKIFMLANYCRYNEAIEAADASLKINPHDASLWYQKAWVLKMYGEDLQINNKDVTISYNDISHIDSIYEEALKCLNKSLELNPLDEHNSTKGLIVDVHAHLLNNIGLKLTTLGRYEEALRAYNESIKIEPHNPFFNYCRLIALHILGSNPNASIMTRQTFAKNMKEPLSNMYMSGDELQNIKPWTKTATISGNTTTSTNSFMKAIDAWANAFHKQMYTPNNYGRKNEFDNTTFVRLPVSYWRYTNGSDWERYATLATFFN